MVIKATISYLGTYFSGFSRQRNKRTVQGVLDEALTRYFGMPIKTVGAGRTDAGVHAVGQVIRFEIPRDIKDIEGERRAIDHLLPRDLTIWKMEVASEDFHPRFGAKAKHYAYSFSFNPRNVFLTGIAFIREGNFDIDLFSKALSLFVGKHDFSCFTSKPKDDWGFVRTIESIDLSYKDGVHTALFKGDGFMTYMIRLIVGSCFKVARGELSLEELKKSIDPETRRILPFKAPAEGLTLMAVTYADE